MLKKILKQEILKETKKVYNLGGKQLIKIQKSFVKEIMKMFKRQYDDAVEELEKNEDLIENEEAEQIESIKKEYTEDELEEFGEHFAKSFVVGASQLDLLVSKEPGVSVKIGIKSKDAVAYADEFAGLRITQIDETTTKRINKLIKHGIEEGWGYNRVAKVLKQDYAFSTYRATLIASHEVGEAYLNGKDTQFNKYREEYEEEGYKNWISHRDDKTTKGCLENDDEGWIKYSKDFKAKGNKKKPTRFIGCRCNINFNLFKPKK